MATLESAFHKIEWNGDDVLKQFEQADDDALFAGGEVLLEVAKSKAPVDDGDLRESGYVATASQSNYTKRPGHRKEVRPTDGVVVVAFAIFYAHIVETTGARAHTIKARPGHQLQIGKTLVSQVRHPGMQPHPYLRPALDESGDKIAEAIAGSLRSNVK